MPVRNTSLNPRFQVFGGSPKVGGASIAAAPPTENRPPVTPPTTQITPPAITGRTGASQPRIDPDVTKVRIGQPATQQQTTARQTTVDTGNYGYNKPVDAHDGGASVIGEQSLSGVAGVYGTGAFQNDPTGFWHATSQYRSQFARLDPQTRMTMIMDIAPLIGVRVPSTTSLRQNQNWLASFMSTYVFRSSGWYKLASALQQKYGKKASAPLLPNRGAV